MIKLRDKIIFLVLTFIALIWLIYSVKSVLAPFACSLIIAYFLDPLVDRLHEKYKLSRLVATSLILFAFLAILSALGAVLLPIIYSQFIALIDIIPQYFQTILNDLYPRIANTLNHLGFKLETSFTHLVENQKLTDKLVDFSQNLFNNAISSSVTIINIISLVFITPILIFYLLKDWDLFIKKVNDYLPRQSSAVIKKIFVDIDKTLSGYVRGQFNVCFILAIVYSSLLSFTGLNFGFLIGFLTGLFSFIPYVGMLCGVSAATVIGLFQWGFEFNHAIAIALVFIFGQILESSFLTPKLIGSKIGLHPVWIIFGLFFFGALFGFVGLLIAVPLTAICGVIIKHLALEYKKRFT